MIELARISKSNRHQPRIYRINVCGILIGSRHVDCWTCIFARPVVVQARNHFRRRAVNLLYPRPRKNVPSRVQLVAYKLITCSSPPRIIMIILLWLRSQIPPPLHLVFSSFHPIYSCICTVQGLAVSLLSGYWRFELLWMGITARIVSPVLRYWKVLKNILTALQVPSLCRSQFSLVVGKIYFDDTNLQIEVLEFYHAARRSARLRGQKRRSWS